MPEKEGIRDSNTDRYINFGDRLKPLYDFLKKNTGRKWDDVWSEICQQNDSRSVRGYHLREHVKEYVTGSGGQEGLSPWSFWNRREFYVDDCGILRYDSRPHIQREPQYDPDHCKIGNITYDRVNGCWFQSWYEKVKRSREYWNYALGRKEPYYYDEDVVVRRKQLSKKELKALGLSNDPDFKWWKPNE